MSGETLEVMGDPLYTIRVGPIVLEEGTGFAATVDEFPEIMEFDLSLLKVMTFITESIEVAADVVEQSK